MDNFFYLNNGDGDDCGFSITGGLSFKSVIVMVIDTVPIPLRGVTLVPTTLKAYVQTHTS